MRFGAEYFRTVFILRRITLADGVPLLWADAEVASQEARKIR